MSIRTADYLDAIEHLPDGATLVVQQFGWDDYERLLEDLRNRPRLRVAYDCGRLEIMSPLPLEQSKTAGQTAALAAFRQRAQRVGR